MSRMRIALVSSDHAEDATLLASLKTHLAPLEREGQLACWDPTHIKAGAVKADAMRDALQAATVAILIVSPELLASDTLRTQVIEPLVARAGPGGVRLIPVFWRPSVVERVGIGPRKVKLTQFAGCGTPEHPLVALSWPDRERALEKLADELVESAGLRPKAPPRSAAASRAPSTSAAASASGGAREYALSIHLEHDDDTLTIGYHVPGVAALAPAARPWGELAHVLDIGRRLDRERLDHVERALDAHADEWGAHLFDLLFGAEAQWGPVLRAVYGVPVRRRQ